MLFPVPLEIDRVIARFLAAPEAAEATWLPKAGLEPECLRSTVGPCAHCGNTGPLWRYEVDELHVPFLGCDCDNDGDTLCATCRVGAMSGGEQVSCDATDIGEECRWAEQLETARVPWLCSPCWRDEVMAEKQHIYQLKAAR
jgi:hypothetical protein